jgi:2-polyprenyl-6-methoxyphenol hydroxylase-like FAD-dependent oxidoreductase
MGDRRQFLKRGLSALGIGFLGNMGLPPGAFLLGQAPPAAPGPSSNPFERLPTDPDSVTIDGFPFARWFTGDDFADPQTIPFHVTWQGSIPTPSEDVEVAIVGGGISGLASAYLLRKHRPVIFDLRPRFGGNARGERWRETAYSLGSAYVITPDAGTFLDRFYRRLGLDQIRREALPPDPVEVAGQIDPGFWSGASLSASERLQFSNYASVVRRMADDLYPEIPLPRDPAAADAVRDLDQWTFRQHLEQQLGEPLHPLLAGALQGYFYSSFGAGMELVSAASGWNFVAAEEYGRWVFPGGNTGMARALWRRLRRVEAKLPSAPPMLRPSCRVVDVRRSGDRVIVTWVDAAGNATALRAKYVIMAGSKHVCKHVLYDIAQIDPDKYDAMGQIQTAAYLVVNVLLEAPSPASSYDVFLVHDRQFPMSEYEAELNPRPIDVLDGNFALPPTSPRSTLTLYWPLPWPTARFSLIMNDPYETYAETLVPHLKRILQLWNVPGSAVKQVRISRWGHAMPIATPNLIRSGVPERLLRPFQERVYFVNQDDWALPAVENSLLDARSVTREIDALL